MLLRRPLADKPPFGDPQPAVGGCSMAWTAKLRGRDGRVSVLGVHGTYSGARRQAEDFNRRYQFDRAYVEPFDAADVPFAPEDPPGR